MIQNHYFKTISTFIFKKYLYTFFQLRKVPSCSRLLKVLKYKTIHDSVNVNNCLLGLGIIKTTQKY